MVDDDKERLPHEPAGAPTNRDRKRDPGVIESEAVRHEDEASERAAEASEAASDRVERIEEAPAFEPPPSSPPSRSDPPPPRRGPSRFGAFVSGAVGGAVVAALALAGGYALLSPNAGRVEADANRIATLESGAEHESAALGVLEKRVAAVEAATKAPSTSQPEPQLSGEVRDLSAKLDALSGLSGRVAKLESAPAPPAPASGPDTPALAARIDKLEQALAAPKTENRVAPEKPAGTTAGNPAAVAIVAEAIHDRLAEGAPFPHELAALASLRVDSAKLAPLKAMADGGPSGQALSSSFATLAPEVIAAANRPQPGASVGERFLAHLRGLVVVHDLDETAAGNDPEALVSQVEALSRRGDLTGALAAFAKLPEPARNVAAGWAAKAGKAEAASAALRSIREDAIGHLAASEGQ